MKKLREKNLKFQKSVFCKNHYRAKKLAKNQYGTDKISRHGNITLGTSSYIRSIALIVTSKSTLILRVLHV